MENSDMIKKKKKKKNHIMLYAPHHQSDFGSMNFIFYVNTFQPSHDNKDFFWNILK